MNNTAKYLQMDELVWPVEDQTDHFHFSNSQWLNCGLIVWLACCSRLMWSVSKQDHYTMTINKAKQILIKCSTPPNQTLPQLGQKILNRKVYFVNI